MKRKIEIVRDTCIPLMIDDIDTDQLVPARFMKTVSKDGFGDVLLYDRRYDADGNERKDFVLNNPIYHGSILVTGKNFGTGSSREHAAWAIAGYGIKVVISCKFADIHKGNELNNFILPAEVSEDFVNRLGQCIKENPETLVEVNLPEQTVCNMSTGEKAHFDIDRYKKYCLINGLDDVDYLVGTKTDIEKWEKKNL